MVALDLVPGGVAYESTAGLLGETLLRSRCRDRRRASCPCGWLRVLEDFAGTTRLSRKSCTGTSGGGVGFRSVVLDCTS